MKHFDHRIDWIISLEDLKPNGIQDEITNSSKQLFFVLGMYFEKTLAAPLFLPLTPTN